MRTASKYVGLLSLFLTFSSICVGQNEYRHLIDSIVSVNADLRLDSLVSKHIRVNKLKDGIDGYRVQLYSGSGNDARQAANDMRAEFLTLYPNIPAYLVYQSPNFKVRVGDYRTELEAIRTQRELVYLYPQGFVVRDVIKFPILEIEKERIEEGEEDSSKD